ncbi:hypothetical protein BVRB_6g134690 [Beta vulgaris subsp. vulgaris]|nr:hypothetical protein BVRB_6g134690 [Beta vulgaris subsp. vulgaris]
MKHFVLVHGLGHGAWCWYKLVLLLRRAGHRVTAVDLDGGCGGDASIDDYVKPLMDLMRSIDVDDDDEKVILVGHSFGGMPISIAMERFPEKISVAVFVSAYMPNCSSPPLTLVQEDLEIAKKLVKPDGLFCEDLAKDSLFTEERFGAVKRVFVMCEEDELMKPDFQKWIIETNPPHQVKSIPKADHMVMISKPRELSLSLLEISN